MACPIIVKDLYQFRNWVHEKEIAVKYGMWIEDRNNVNENSYIDSHAALRTELICNKLKNEISVNRIIKVCL